MFVERIKTPGIAHNAYLLGSKGIGIVFDPRRDVDVYTRLAQQKKCSIEYVFETHRQEDFVLGSAACAACLARSAWAALMNFSAMPISAWATANKARSENSSSVH
jgi:glyoxylase-like metal-dependent hydrolase (beta-lactamase superfamily II)